jgi:thiol-disulfide isomerase/thioredoxin
MSINKFHLDCTPIHWKRRKQSIFRLMLLLQLVHYWTKVSITSAFIRPSPSQQTKNTYGANNDRSTTRLIKQTSQAPTRTTLYTTSLKFKNFDTMLHAFPNETVLVYFSSNVCGGCKLQKKELTTIQSSIGSTTGLSFTKRILTIDAHQFPQVCLRYNVTKLPCILLIKDGTVLVRLDGFTSAHDLVQHFYPSKPNDLCC